MTIKDIAKKSGYAVSTVSRVLNGHPDVSSEAKKHITQVVQEMGFVPNSNARQLKSQISRNVLILIKGANNLFFSGVLEMLEADFSKQKYSTQLHYLDEDEDEIALALRLQREVKPLGFIFLGADIKGKDAHLKQIKVPAVIATTVFNGFAHKKICCVGIDDTEGGKLAAEYLIDKRHKNIAVLGGKRDASPISLQRYMGFAEVYKARFNEQFPEELYEKCSFSMDSAYRAIGRLIQRGQKFTAVFCMSDVIAMGAMRALFDMGLTVPRDVSVLGFDGISTGQYCVPRLSTISQPQKDISTQSVKLLIDTIEGKSTGKNIILPCELCVRESG